MDQRPALATVAGPCCGMAGHALAVEVGPCGGMLCIDWTWWLELDCFLELAWIVPWRAIHTYLQLAEINGPELSASRVRIKDVSHFKGRPALACY